MITIDMYSRISESEVIIHIITKDVIYLPKKAVYIYDFKNNKIVEGDLEILENIEYAINGDIIEEFKKITKLFRQ